MYHFLVGTKAQFIKLAPVMLEMDRRGIPYRHLDLGQHAATTERLRRVFALPPPAVHLRRQEGDITRVGTAIGWASGLLLRARLSPGWRRRLFPEPGLCLIHGDTLSTLLGLHLARAAGLPVAHVEAGLRSFHLLDPFPEELIRIHCMRRADYLFCPDDGSVRNLQAMRVRGRIQRLSGNTVIDAVRLMAAGERPLPGLPASYGVATCHRLETLSRGARLQRVVQLLNQVAERIPVLFVVHHPTRQALARHGLAHRLGSGVRILDPLDYAGFLPLLRDAALVLTDGGSIQEECASLGRPCVVLRNRSERPDGLGANAMLWNGDDQAVMAFVAERARHQRAPLTGGASPSAEIVDFLEQRQRERRQGTGPGG